MTVAPRAPLPASTSNEDYRKRYLDEIAPQTIVGAMVKFDKDGSFVRQDTEEAIDDARQFLALCGDVLVGWLRFNGQGEPPTRSMGLLYSDWVMPPRESLGDTNTSTWEKGLDGQDRKSVV